MRLHPANELVEPIICWNTALIAAKAVTAGQVIVKLNWNASGLPGLDDADWNSAGGVLFTENCATCHGERGLGVPNQGAPNLADSISLYGNDPESLTQTITYARYGVMPAWGQRLSEADVRAVSAYVHSLGGGE